MAKNSLAKKTNGKIECNMKETMKEIERQKLIPVKVEIFNEPVLMLTKHEAKILSNHLKNEYLTHEEPARSVLLKVHHFADK